MSAPDRRDRDELTDRDDLAALVNGRPLPGPYPRRIGEIYERDAAYERADEILAAGWVHWPHECDKDKP